MGSQPEDEADLWSHEEAVKKVRARYANQIFVQPLNEGMVRINFGDVFDTVDPVYHTSIVTTPELALQFVEVIARVTGRLIQAQQEIAEGERAVKEAAERFAAEGRPSSVLDAFLGTKNLGVKKTDGPGGR